MNIILLLLLSLVSIMANDATLQEINELTRGVNPSFVYSPNVDIKTERLIEIYKSVKNDNKTRAMAFIIHEKRRFNINKDTYANWTPNDLPLLLKFAQFLGHHNVIAIADNLENCAQIEDRLGYIVFLVYFQWPLPSCCDSCRSSFYKNKAVWLKKYDETTYWKQAYELLGLSCRGYSQTSFGVAYVNALVEKLKIMVDHYPGAFTDKEIVTTLTDIENYLMGKESHWVEGSYLHAKAKYFGKKYAVSKNTYDIIQSLEIIDEAIYKKFDIGVKLEDIIPTIQLKVNLMKVAARLRPLDCIAYANVSVNDCVQLIINDKSSSDYSYYTLLSSVHDMLFLIGQENGFIPLLAKIYKSTNETSKKDAINASYYRYRLPGYIRLDNPIDNSD